MRPTSPWQRCAAVCSVRDLSGPPHPLQRRDWRQQAAGRWDVGETSGSPLLSRIGCPYECPQHALFTEH